MNSDQVCMTIEDLLELDSQGALHVDSEYQRGPEWNVKQERLLIDSLMRGYPIPMFYFHKKSSTSRLASNTYYYIIDGQQRKNAIVRYVTNAFSMFDPCKDSKTGLAHFQRNQPVPWASKSFDALPATLREKFMQTTLLVVMVETNEDNEIRDLFIRLQAGLPLSAQEKRDAWPGEFTKFIVEMAGKTTSRQTWSGHDFFHKVLKGSGRRGNMRKLCASMFMQFYSRRINNYAPESFTSANALDIDNFYQYNVDFDSNNEKELGPRFREILDEATHLLGDGKRPKIEAHMAYNVVLFLDILMGNFLPDWKPKFLKAFDTFQENLANARRNKSKNQQDEYWIQYGVLTGVSAASKGRIEERYRFFEKKMLEMMQSLARFDTKRMYSPAEREIIYFRDRGVCQKCKYPVDWTDSEIDHIVPHALGGATTLENARLIHRNCHLRGKQALTEIKEQPSEEVANGEGVNKPWEEPLDFSGKDMKLDPSGKRIRVQDLADAGLIVNGCFLIYATKTEVYKAEFRDNVLLYRENGRVHEYTNFNTLIADKIGNRNIWAKTIVEFPDGHSERLEHLRDCYVELACTSASLEDDEEE